MDAYQLLIFALAFFLVFVGLKVLYRPLKAAFFILYYMLLGGLMLWSVNFVGRLIGLHLPINPVSSLVAGYMGVPGICLVYALLRALG